MEFPNDNRALHAGAIARWPRRLESCERLGPTHRFTPESVPAIDAPAAEVTPCGAEPLARWAKGDAAPDSPDDIEIVDDLVFEAVPEGPFVTAPARRAAAAQIPTPIAVCASPVLAPALCRPSGPTPSGDDDASLDESPPSETRSEGPTDPFTAFGSVVCRVASGSGAGPDSLDFLRALLGLERIDDRSPGAVAVEALVAGKLVVRTARGLARAPAFHECVVAWRAVLRGEIEDLTACGSMSLDEWAADVIARTIGDPSRASVIRRELRALGVAAFGLLASTVG